MGKKVLQLKGLKEILNAEHEILNKHKVSKSQCSKPDLLEFRVLDLGFVSDFDIRISDFSMRLLGSGYAGLGIFAHQESAWFTVPFLL
jgi:hypothetical protein